MHIVEKDLVAKLSEQTGGEQLAAAVYARFDTAFSLAHWLTPIGNYLIARPAARAAASRASERTDLPLDAAIVFGVGRENLHIWSADPMLSQVKEHLGSVELAHVTSMETEPARTWAPLKLTLASGEGLECEARGDVSGLVAAFERARSAT